jgi:hypothetical protein
MSDGHNARFLADPRQYLTQVLVLLNDGRFNGQTAQQQMMAARGGGTPASLRAYDRVYLNLVPIDGRGAQAAIVRADFSTSSKWFGTDIAGGYTPYIFEGVVNANPGRMGRHNLPPGGVPAYEFTGAMQGCSLVLCTDNANGGRVSVHYPNSGGSIAGYPHLATLGLTRVKSLDYFNTGGGRGPQASYTGQAIGTDRDVASTQAGNANGWFNTFGFMKYEAGQWRLIDQPQFLWMDNGGRTTGRIAGAVVEI